MDSHCVDPWDCIGEGRPGRHVHVAARLPSQVRDVDVERLLEEQVARGPLARLGPEALVLVYLPPGVALSDAFHSHYCDGGPRAYHRSLKLEPRGSVAYAVVPRCGDIDKLTGVASHEILEGATNPDPQARGFAFESSAGSVAFTASGLEPVDPCGLITRDGHWTFEGSFAVQRAWSNRAAAGGHDPCVPGDPGRAYRALVPGAPTLLLVSAGDRATIQLEAAADRAVAPWEVSAVELRGTRSDGRHLELELDRTMVEAGDVVTLTVRLVRPHPQHMAIVGLVSGAADRGNIWPLAVITR